MAEAMKTEELRPATWLGYAMDKMGDDAIDGVPYWKLGLFAQCLQNLLNENAPDNVQYHVQASSKQISEDIQHDCNAQYVAWTGTHLKWVKGGHALWQQRRGNNEMISTVVPQYVEQAWELVQRDKQFINDSMPSGKRAKQPVDDDALTAYMAGKNGLTVMMNIRRLGYIRRCNNYPTLVPDTVASHSYNVAMLSLAIGAELQESGMEVYLGNVMLKALCHDVPEAFTGDVQYHVKHNNPQIENGFDIATRRIVDDAFSAVKNGSGVLKIKKAADNSKSGLDGQLVALCDMLDLAIYSYEEIMRGNTMFTSMLRHALHYLEADNGLTKPFKSKSGDGLLRSNLLQSIMDLLHTVRLEPKNDATGLYTSLYK